MTTNDDRDDKRAENVAAYPDWGAAYDRLEWRHEPYRGFGDPDKVAEDTDE